MEKRFLHSYMTKIIVEQEPRDLNVGQYLYIKGEERK